METQNAFATSFQAVSKKPRRKRSQKAMAEALRNFDSLPNSAYVREPVVSALRGCSSATTWRHVRQGLLPKPHKLSPQISAWNVGELRQAMRGSK